MSEHNSITELPTSILPPLSQDDGIYKFLRGKECNLDSLRAKLQNPSSSEDNNSAQNKSEESENEESILYQLQSVSVTIQNIPNAFENIIGFLIMTTKRVFFVPADEKESDNDFCIDAQCISLHAMMSEPQPSIYCQLTDGSVSYDNCNNNDMDNESSEGENDDSMRGPAEIFFHPILVRDEDTGTLDGSTMEEEKAQVCDTLFKSFSKLINMNPVDDDDDEDGGNAFGGLGAMLGMLANGGGYGDDDEGDSDEMICRIDTSQINNSDDGAGGASNSERSAMLERLDNMLVVPPQYEIDGQFDDADEDECKDVQMDDDDKDIL